jgi:hypothetical protein
MRGQTVARILLVITLIVAAHAIKPFSAKNIASHLLYSSRSLAVILPDSARSSFDHANQLALTLSDSLFSDKQPGLPWSKERSANEHSIAINPKSSTDITSYETWAPIKKARASMKRRFTAAGPGPAGLIIPREFPAAMPLTLPALRLKMECALLKRTQPLRVDMFHLVPPKTWRIYEPKKAGCDKLNGKQTKLIAFLEKTKERWKFDRISVEQSIYKMLECEETETEATTEEGYHAESQEMSSPTKEFDGLSVTDPQQRPDNCIK